MRLKVDIFIGFISSILFFLIFLGGMLPVSSDPLAHHDDLDLYYFLYENNWRKFSQGDFSHLFTTRMFYPKQNTLAFGNSVLTQSFMGWPIYLATKNVITATHGILVVNFVFSFFACYLLAYYLTKNVQAGILAGVIYTYNPFVLGHFPNRLELLTLEFIPLIFLATEKFLEKKPGWRICLVLMIFFLLQVGSSLYYAFFIGLFWPIYLSLRILSKKVPVSNFLTLPVVACLILLVFSLLLYLRPYQEVRQRYQIVRNLTIIKENSANLADFFFTTVKNKTYGSLVMHPKLRTLRPTINSINNWEHSLFPGFSVYFFIIIGLCFALTRQLKKHTSLVNAYFLVLMLAILLSIGPVLSIGTFSTASLYEVLYKLLPFTDTLRVPSRFMVIGYLAKSMIIAVVWVYFVRRLSRLRTTIVFFIFILILIFEYRHTLPSPRPIRREIRTFYSWLDGQRDIRVVVELPMANNLIAYPERSRNIIADAQYLLYALYHQKYLLNGYNGFVPPDTFELGIALAVDFPSSDGLVALKDMGVDTIIVHEEEYWQKEKASRVVEQLRDLNVEEVYDHSPIHAFRIPSAQ